MLGFEQAALRISQQALAGLGKRHAARTPLEQHGAEFAFEPRNLPADRRHRDVQPRGRVAERAGASYFDKVAQRDAM